MKEENEKPKVKVVPFEGHHGRWVIVNESDGSVIDDAQGYGYKTPRNAHAAYAYLTRDKSKDAERKKKRAAMRKWLKTHEEFCEMVDCGMFYAMKDDEKYGIKDFREALKEAGLEPPFEVRDLWKEYTR